MTRFVLLTNQLATSKTKLLQFVFIVGLGGVSFQPAAAELKIDILIKTNLAWAIYATNTQAEQKLAEHTG